MQNEKINKSTKVAIIGAGVSGLTSLKSVIEEGLEADLYEKNSTPCGIWSSENGLIWENMISNTSQYTTQFSDFYWEDKGEAHLLLNKDIEQFLLRYIEKFSLNKYINLNSEVVSIKKNNSLWDITIKSLINNTTRVVSYGKVIICTGVQSSPNYPSYKGLFDVFKGGCIHSNSFKDPRKYENKKVLIIGSGFSGISIAEALYNVNKSPVTISQRSGQFIAPLTIKGRLYDYCHPSIIRNRDNVKDHYCSDVNARYEYIYKALVEVTNNNDNIPELQVTKGSKLRNSFSDNALRLIKEGNLKIRPEIKEFLKDKVVYIDNTEEVVDEVICCTGYRNNLSFLDEEILKVIEYEKSNYTNPIILYKACFHPEVDNLCFVGMFGNFLWNQLELQSRFAAKVTSGAYTKPSKERLDYVLSKERECRDNDYFIYYWEVNDFCDSIAYEIGCKPDFELLKEAEEELYNELHLIPVISPTFRLFGQDAKKEKALEYIKEVVKHIKQ